MKWRRGPILGLEHFLKDVMFLKLLMKVGEQKMLLEERKKGGSDEGRE